MIVLFILLFAETNAQQIQIAGKVLNATQKEALPGATILEKGTANGVLSGPDGNFSISVSPNAILVCSFVGMNTQEIQIGESTFVTFNLSESVSLLDEIVVTGYMTQKKVDLTGAVSVVDLETLADQVSANMMQALQGRVPGLYIETTGDPTGRTRNLLIRGINTLGNTSPLYIIDGIPSKDANVFNYMDPNSIESIQVLKDAAAASIYGSRASNGVIIVTTRKGKDKFKVEFNSSTAPQWFTRRIKVCNTEEYGRALWQAAVNDGTDPIELEARYTYDWHTENGIPVLDKIIPVEFVGNNPLLRSTDTDWQSAIFRQGLITNNSIVISGGTENSSLLISVGHHHNKSVIKHNFFDLINGQINSSVSFLDGKIKIGQDLHIARSEEAPLSGDHNGPGIANFNSTTVISNAFFMQTRLPVFDANGDFAGPTGTGFSDRNNPLHVLWLHRDNRVNNLMLFGNVYLEAKPIKNLLLRSTFGIDYDDVTKWAFERTYQEGFLSRLINYMEKLKGSKFNWTWSTIANYNIQIERSKFDFLLGMEAIKNDYQQILGYKEGFADQTFDYFQFSAGTGVATLSGYRSGHQLLSYFSKINYSWSDKYLASATLRVDGSSRFGENNRFGFFPAATLGWRIDKEAFMANATYISNLKLRSGYGIVGNQEIGDEARFGLYATNYGSQSGNRITGTAYDINGTSTGNLPSGYVATQIANSNLKWESTSEMNFGIDFGFFDEKLIGSFDYFSRNTRNILTRPPYPAAMGEGSYQFLNGATMKNKGFEIVLGNRGQIGGFSYNLLGSVTSFRDKITYLPESVVKSYAGNEEKTILGHSVTSVFGYWTDGIFQNEEEVAAHAEQPGNGVGRLRYVDMNHDGVIDTYDQDWIGTTLPDFEYGINAEIGYKNFSFTIFGQGVAGKTVSDGLKGSTDFASGQGMNFGKRVLEAWTPQNPSSDIPMLSAVNRNNETRSSNYMLVKGDYFKIRNATLSYTLPRNISQKLKVDLLRIYLMGENFLLIKPTGKGSFTGPDPETPGTLYPRPVVLTMGVNVTL